MLKRLLLSLVLSLCGVLAQTQSRLDGVVTDSTGAIIVQHFHSISFGTWRRL